MIKETLQKLGLNEKEAEIYLTILRYGRISPSILTKHVNINRTTVYSVSKELIKKGFVSEDLGSSAHFLIATDPKDLWQIINKEEKVLTQKKELVSSAIRELSLMAFKSSPSVPRIRFIEEDKIEKFLFSEIDKWNRSIKKYDGIWWGFQDKTFAENYQKWIIDYWSYPSSKGVGVRGITDQFQTEKDLKQKGSPSRLMKYQESSEEFSSTFWVAGDFILTVSTHEHPYYMVEFHDPVLSQNLRQIFKQIWKMNI